MLALPLFLLALQQAAVTLAAPSPPIEDRAFWSKSNKAAVQPISDATKAEIGFYASLTEASYCSAKAVTAWACGQYCDANPGVVTLAAGGHDQAIPGWYVAWVPEKSAIVVSHQGTNPESVISIASDLAFAALPLRQDLFPSTTLKIKVHSGFSAVQSLTHAQILAAVKQGMTTYATSTVITTGHSLGAAIAVLDALYIKLAIPSADVKLRAFAPPRVGNDDFSDFFGSIIPDSMAIINNADPVPRLPPTALGFEQIPGQIWINSAGTYVSCPGVENVNCNAGVSAFKLKVNDHAGPYDGVTMGQSECPL